LDKVGRETPLALANSCMDVSFFFIMPFHRSS
jgi:hypothetical protein